MAVGKKFFRTFKIGEKTERVNIAGNNNPLWNCENNSDIFHKIYLRQVKCYFEFKNEGAKHDLTLLTQLM